MHHLNTINTPFPLCCFWSSSPPKSTSSVWETKAEAPGHLCCARAWDTGLPLIARLGFSFHGLLRYPADSAPSTSLPCISAFFSLPFNVWSFSALLSTTIYFVLSLEKPEQRRACAVGIASLLLAQMGTADVIREDTREAGRECALCFSCMLNTLPAPAQVKDCNASAAFRVLSLCVKAMMKYTLYCQVSSIQGIYHTAARARTNYALHIIFGFEEACASPYNYQSFE